MKLIIFFLLIFITISYSWDYFLFVQVWPGNWLKHDHINYNFTNDYFIIHGIWPEYINGSWPEFCNNTKKFNINELESINKLLTKYWTNFRNPIKFWKHEYRKHQSCAKSDPIFNTEFKYFLTGLFLFFQSDIYKTLKDNEIIPTNKYAYSVNKFIYILEKKYNSTIVITCSKDQIISEVIICFDKNLNTINCPKNEIKKKCKYNKIIYNKI